MATYDFTGENGDPLPSGLTVTRGSAEIQNNKLALTGASPGTPGWAITYDRTGSIGQQAVFNNSTLDGAGHLFFRYADAQNTWFAQLDFADQEVNLFSLVAGGFTKVETAAMDLTANTDYTLLVEDDGENISVLLDGNPLFYVFNNQFGASPNGAVGGTSSTITIDNLDTNIDRDGSGGPTPNPTPDPDPTPVTPPTVAKMVKAPNSASSYIWQPVSGNRVTMGKIECPTRFTHARVFVHSAGACAGLKVAVAPTSQSSNATADLSYKPYNAQGSEDLALWQSGTMPDITSAMVDNPNPYDSSFMATSVSDWFEVDAIPDGNGKYHLMVRIQTETGEHTIVGDPNGTPSAMERFTGADGEPYYRMFLAAGSTGITDAHDFTQIGSQPLTGGYTHLFAIEFGVEGVTETQDAPSMVALGDSITADAVTNPGHSFNIWPLVALGNAASTANKEFFFTNQAKSGRSEQGAGYARDYLDLIANGVKFDYVLCPAFTPNGGGPNSLQGADDTPRYEQQETWLDELVATTLSEGSKLILWEGIPNQGYESASDSRRIQINEYGRSLANSNAHVYFIEIGSQVNTGASPDRVQSIYSADDFHLNSDGNDVLAAYAQTEFENIIFNISANQPPTANAGPDQSVAAGATCILDGTASIDGDGAIVSYSWEKVSGPTIALANANQSVASFIAPSESTPQTFEFELTVTDDDDATSAPDTVTVTVAAIPEVVDPLDPTLSVINIKSKVGIEDDVQSFGVVSLYQYTDNFILCEVMSKTSTTLTPNSFSQAEYRIVDNKGVNVVKLELGAGIKEADGKFLIHINSGILNSSHKGSLKHQFVVWNQAGHKLPPIFGGTVNIIPVLEPTL